MDHLAVTVQDASFFNAEPGCLDLATALASGGDCEEFPGDHLSIDLAGNRNRVALDLGFHLRGLPHGQLAFGLEFPFKRSLDVEIDRVFEADLPLHARRDIENFFLSRNLHNFLTFVHHGFSPPG